MGGHGAFIGCVEKFNRGDHGGELSPLPDDFPFMPLSTVVAASRDQLSHVDRPMHSLSYVYVVSLTRRPHLVDDAKILLKSHNPTLFLVYIRMLPSGVLKTTHHIGENAFRSLVLLDPPLGITLPFSREWYVDQLSRSLHVEYKRRGVDVQCQIPLYVATKMSPVKGYSPFIPSPEEYAEAAVRCVGYEPRCVPYWRHSVQWFLLSMLPDSALNLWRLRVGISKRNERKKALLGVGESER
uniref:Uncharacterized protein n=1 Tax=Oryza brachyantha TaxID=4533 RepID=J3N7Z6_ORYBR